MLFDGTLLVMVAPAGTLQLYPVAPDTVGTEKTTPVAPGHALATPVIAAGMAGALVMVMQRGALVDDPPQDNAAVTHSCPVVNAGGNVTWTLVLPCPLVTGAADPDSVQLYTDAPPDAPQLYGCMVPGQPTAEPAMVPAMLTSPLIHVHLLFVLPQPFTPCTHILYPELPANVPNCA